MARPRKSDRTKQDLLVVGTRMLTDHGYHGTGIKQVLDAVGVPKGSFYNFFPSKEAFVASSIYYYGEQMREAFSQATAGLEQEPALVQLWYSFQNKVRNEVNEGIPSACLLGAMSAEIAHASPLCRGAITAVASQWIEILQNYIQQAQKQGDLRDDLKAQDIAPVLYNYWEGSLLHYQVSDNPNELLQHLWIFVSTLMTSQGHLTFTNSDVCTREIRHD
jgi:TetR/AcrR family transcriptional repressor of nem operon